MSWYKISYIAWNRLILKIVTASLKSELSGTPYILVCHSMFLFSTFQRIALPCPWHITDDSGYTFSRLSHGTAGFEEPPRPQFWKETLKQNHQNKPEVQGNNIAHVSHWDPWQKPKHPKESKKKLLEGRFPENLSSNQCQLSFLREIGLQQRVGGMCSLLEVTDKESQTRSCRAMAGASRETRCCPPSGQRRNWEENQ